MDKASPSEDPSLKSHPLAMANIPNEQQDPTIQERTYIHTRNRDILFLFYHIRFDC